MAAQTLLGLALGELIKLVQELMGEMKAFESILKKMESTVSQMKPIVEKVPDLNQNLDSRTDGKTSGVLLGKIKEGQGLIRECSEEMKRRCFCLKKCRYSKQLQELYTSIKEYCDIIVPLETHNTVTRIEEKVDRMTRVEEKVDKIMDELKGQKNSQGTPMQRNPSIGGQGSSRESKEQPEQLQSGAKEANHRENLPSPPTNGASNLPPFQSLESKGWEDSHPTRTPNNVTSNLQPPKSPEIGNDVKSTGCGDLSLVDSSASLHRPTVSPKPTPEDKDSPEEVGKPKQLECANPPDDKVSQGSLLGNTTSLAPVATSKVKGASNLHPPKSSEIENDVKSMVGCGDPSVVDSSASLHGPFSSPEPAPKMKGFLEEVGKLKQLEDANLSDDKVNKGSVSGNTTSLGSVAHPAPSKVKGRSNVHPPKSLEIGNDVKPTVCGDPSLVDFSASLHRSSASPEPAPKMKGFLEEVGKPRQLEYANPSDDKVNKGLLSGNTTSLAPVTPLVPCKVKGASNLHPPNEIGNDVKSAGHGDPPLVDFSASLHRPSASSEPASKMKGFLDEASKPRQLHYANPPDDKVGKKSLSGNTTSLAPVAPPAPFKVKGSPQEPYKKIIGQDSKDKVDASMPFSLPNFHSQEELKMISPGINPGGQPWHSNDPPRRTSVPTAGSDSMSLRTSTRSTPPRIKEPDEGANHIPNLHSISSDHNSTVAKDHIPQGHPTVPEKTPDAKIIPEGVKNRPTELKRLKSKTNRKERFSDE